MKDTNEVVSKDSSFVDFGSSWRYLYPIKSVYRTHIVLDVWRNLTPEKNLVEGFRNTDKRSKYLALCEFSISNEKKLHDSQEIRQPDEDIEAHYSGSGAGSFFN